MAQMLYQPESEESARIEILQPPSATLASPGSALLGLIYHIDVKVKTDESGVPLTYSSGQPRKTTIALLLIAQTTGEVLADVSTSPRPLAPGDLAACWLEGRRLRQWDESARRLPQGGVEVGTRLTWELTSLTQPQGNRQQPGKVYSYTLMPREETAPEWVRWTELCDEKKRDHAAAAASMAAPPPAVPGLTEAPSLDPAGAPMMQLGAPAPPPLQ